MDTTVETLDSGGAYHSVNDEPARVINNGEIMYWYSHGDLHRTGDLPAIMNGLLAEFAYFNMGRRSRINGPAIITPCKQLWYYNNKLHNTSGPAIITTHNKRLHAKWALHGKQLTFNEWTKNVDISDEQVVILKLTYC